MPAPSRDRLSRPVDISILFRGAARRVNLMVDEPGLRWLGLSGSPTRNVSGMGRVGVGVNNHRMGIGSLRNHPSLPPVGQENRAPWRRGGGGSVTRERGSVLPHWYPRTPLREITGIVRAIESRRAELRADQRREPSSDNTNNAPLVFGAQPEHHEIGASTPLPTILMKPQTSPATQTMSIKDCITVEVKQDNADVLTPEKKLLNSIEKVREVWLKEQRKLEQTPAAKKAERERKVKTLRTMR